jgi:hypothetical protein
VSQALLNLKKINRENNLLNTMSLCHQPKGHAQAVVHLLPSSQHLTLPVAHVCADWRTAARPTQGITQLCIQLPL